MPGLTLVAVVIFALVHLFVGKMRFLDGVPRSRWLSLAGGIAVAYVFLHILPELSTHEAKVHEAGIAGGIFSSEVEIYLVALAGLATFYGLERVVSGSRAQSRKEQGVDEPEPRVFWIHIGSFAVYNALISYLLLHREQPGLVPLVVYTVAMALHFITSDYGLRQDYKEAYQHKARWVLAGAVFVGWLLGLVVEVSELIVGLLFAFLAGGVVLNVLKEELPQERRSRFLPFAGGLVVYAVLLLIAG